MVKRVYSSKRTKGFIIGERNLFMKVFYNTSLKVYLKSLKTIYTKSRPENEFFFSNFLRKKGIRTLKVVKCKSKRFLKLLKLDIGYTISEYEEFIPLDKLKNHKEFNRLVLESVYLSSKIHNLSLKHGDLALSNFAYNGEELIVLDLETMQFTFSIYQAAKEFPDFLHDIWKCKKDINVLDLLKVYISQIKLSTKKKKKLENFTLNKLKKWGIL